MELTAFTNLLLSLADKELSLNERNSLSQIVNGLFNDLDLGHTCSILSNEIINLSVDDQIKLLLKSKLAHEYTNFPDNLQPLPISILNINDKKLVYITKYLQYELDILNKIKLLSNSVSKSQKPYHTGLDCNSNSDCHPRLDRGSMLSNSTPDQQPRQLLEELSTKSGIPNTEQLEAIYNSLKHKFSIITGGPGTGKTTTVALLLWLMYQNYGDNLKIKICAPTGKSSKRVKDSIEGSLNNPSFGKLDFNQIHKLLESRDNFQTIHKLLGYQANSIYFKHNKNNLLDLDILIIDECSMVSLPLFSKLLQAIDTDKIRHIILLGDKNQLSSVEEGYVFASLVNTPSIKQHVTNLVTSNRSNKEISELAAAIQAGNSPKSDTNRIKNYKAKLSDLFDKQLFTSQNNSLNTYFEYIKQADVEDIPQLFKEYNKQTVLCLTNVGLFGTIYLNTQIEKKIRYLLANINNEIESPAKAYDLFSATNTRRFDIVKEWYTGRPIIILENDYSLELFNGDVGICIITDDKPQVVFENGRKFIPEILPKYQVAYAITIHKSQGSEYEHVNLVLCDNSGMDSMSELLTKELAYTGITRAKTSLSIFAGDKVLPYAIINKTLRNTGLDLMLC